MTTKTTDHSKNRLHYIDNLKILLTIIVVVLHSWLPYGLRQGARLWYYVNPSPNPLVVQLIAFSLMVFSAFGMGLFLMISGYFASASYDRKGPTGFLKDRLLRLTIPALGYILLIEPFLWYVKQVNYEGLKLSFWNYYPNFIMHSPNFSQGPMWFLMLLTIFSICYVLWRWVRVKVPGVNRFWLDKLRSIVTFKKPFLPSKTGIFITMITVLVLCTFLVRLRYPMAEFYQILKIIHLDFSHLPQYVALFMVGILAYRNNWLTKLPSTKLWAKISLVVLLTWPLLIAQIILGPKMQVQPFFGGFNLQSLLYSCWETVACIVLCIFFLSVFKAKFNSQAKFTKILSKNAFTVYIIHTPILVALQYAFHKIELPSLLKILLIAILGVTISFSISHLIRKLAFKTWEDRYAGKNVLVTHRNA